MSIEDSIYDLVRDEVERYNDDRVRDVEGNVASLEQDMVERFDDLTSQLEQACEGSTERIARLDRQDDAITSLLERVQRLEHSFLNPYVGPSRPDVVAHLNDEQRRCIFSMLSELTHGVQMNRETRLKIVGYAAGRNIVSFNELTEFEADEVIGQLDTVLFVNRQVGK